MRSNKPTSRTRGGNPKEFAPVRWEYDLYQTKYSARDKPQPVPASQIFDAPYACVKINFDWLVHLIGALDALSQGDAWQGGEGETFRAQQNIEALLNALQSTLGCVEIGVNTLLRQNPANKCQLQQSQDGGVTWSLAFDYSLCRSRGQTIINNIQIDNSSQTYNENNNQSWTDSSQNLSIFAPTVIFDGGQTANDLRRDLALCYAIQAIVEALYQTFLNNDDGIVDLVGVIGGAVGTLIIASTGVGALALIIGGLLSAGGARVAMDGLLNTVDSIYFNNQKADLICHLYNAMRGETVTQVRFQSSINGFGTLLEDALQPMFDDLTVYLDFVKLIAEAYDISQYATLPDCPCDEWEFIVNFEQSDGGFVPYGYNSYLPATFTSGVGWVGGYFQDFGIARGLTACWIYRAFAQPTTLTYAEFTYTRTRGVTAIPEATDRVQDGAGTFIVNEPWTTATSPIIWEGEETVTDLYCLVRSGVNNNNQAGNPGGQAIIKTATIRGKGYNPFI